MSNPEAMAFAFAYEGKVVGDAFETAMGWRPTLDAPGWQPEAMK
jgi:hypothetical protein